MSDELEVQVSPEEQGAIPAKTNEDSGDSQRLEGDEPVVKSEEVADGAAPDQKRKPVQQRIDELVKQREDWRRESETWREMAMRQPAPPITEAQQTREVTYDDLPKPNSDNFDTYDAYVEAIADWKAEVKLRQVQEERATISRAQTVKAWHEQAQAKYPDWKEVFTGNVNISQGMAEVLLESEQGVDLGYYLAKNPKEATRIFNLPYHRQAYELGKIEVLMSAPAQRSKTSAPVPTSPVGTRDVAAKKPDEMTMEEYRAWRTSGGGR